MSEQILSPSQIRRIEAEAIASGDATGPGLMRAAAQAVVGAIQAEWPDMKAGEATVLCGPGLNGGDGYLIAGLLADRGWDVSVVPLGDHDALPPDAAAARAAWLARDGHVLLAHSSELPIEAPADMDNSFQEMCVASVDLVIDAMLGLGGRGDLPSGWADFLGFARWNSRRIVAVDGHSGLDLSTGRSLGPRRSGAFHADLTVTFHALKPGHVLADGPQLSGRVVVGDIGLFNVQRRLEHSTGRLVPLGRTITGAGAAAGKSGGHKYQHGHALVLAGPTGHEGAAMLAASAALRIGAGLVTLGRTADAGTAVLRPLALMQTVIGDEADLARLLEDARINCICLGPGLGVARAAALLPAALGGIVRSPVSARSGQYRTAVLDAGALTAIAGDPARLMPLLGENCILTPHEGEFARLFPCLAENLADRTSRYSRIDAAMDAARASGAIVLLKGPDTVIAVPGEPALVHTATDVPWLATAGAGDVLAGLIAGLLARGFAPAHAAAAATFLHAAAARRFGPGLIADDLPDQIPAVLTMA